MRYLILILLIPSFSFADEWDDAYKANLKLIEEANTISTEKGYRPSDSFSRSCGSFVLGYVLGEQKNGGFRIFSSKRYKDWIKKKEALSNKIIHFLNTKDYGHASYYAKETYKLNCQYKRDILKYLYPENIVTKTKTKRRKPAKKRRRSTKKRKKPAGEWL